MVPMTEAFPTVPGAAAAPHNLQIRDFDRSDADYAAIMDIHNSNFPDYHDTVEEQRHHDATRDEQTHIKHRRLVALVDDTMVGYGSYSQSIGQYHPRKFYLSMDVRPDWQGRGVGRVLYNALTTAMETHSPLSVRLSLREDMQRSRRFVEDRGFVESSRSWESRLDLRTFDFTPFAGKVAGVIASGISITTLTDLIARDPDHRRKLYDLDCEATFDEPLDEPFTPPGQAAFDRWLFDSPDLRPDGFFIALDGERYAGLSSLFTNQATPQRLSVGFTGTGRDYRRRGIALALKLCTVAYARRAGFHEIKTFNASTNQAMLSINEALGFVKQPAWISYVRIIRKE